MTTETQTTNEVEIDEATAKINALAASNHSRVSDVVPQDKNDSEGEIERLRAINAQLVAALQSFVDADGMNYATRASAIIKAVQLARTALNAAEKESNK